MPDVRQQAVTGLIPPQLHEAIVRVKWPALMGVSLIATIGRQLSRTVILAPVAWLLMAPFFFGKVLPFIGRRYVLTNRRLYIGAGWAVTPIQEISLDKIDEVKVVTDANSDFYRTATLIIMSEEKEAMKLYGVMDPEAFKHAIINTRNAWFPERAKSWGFVPASEK